MRHDSTPQFLTTHALRIRGLATTSAIVEMTALDEPVVTRQLGELLERGLATFREQRALWQLTPDGRSAHEAALADELRSAPPGLGAAYARFLDLNGEFKALCGRWQLRDGAPNEHLDEAYDRDVVDGLRTLHARVAPVLESLAQELPRLGGYQPRLDAALARVTSGDASGFTGVMCGSYHDVWMELHEDLILTQQLDRSAEGSF